tara:strand:- start:40 stop:519 length:480 start_codon:yes stop_codon:yes gene_type:complete
MSSSYPDNIRNIINGQDGGPHDNNNNAWFRNTFNKYKNQYINGVINISPQFHHDVYGETVDLNNRELTPCVCQHISLFYCYAGGFNNNDYSKLPIQYRQHFHKMVSNESYEGTVSNCTNIAELLINDYNMPESVSYVIAWFWTSGDKYRQVIINDAAIE